VKRSFRHSKYHKIITTSKKYLCQYDNKDKEIPIGTKVTLRQIAPQSKRKNTLIESITGEN
jgi:ribosomal protein S17